MQHISEAKCKQCTLKYYMHGANDMCPPYTNKRTTFIPVSEVTMKATDLALAFEQEWIERYPDMRFFTVDSVIRDIIYHRSVLIESKTVFNGLVSFLTKYLKEHPTRFEYAGMYGFRVVAKITTLVRADKKLQQSPN